MDAEEFEGNMEGWLKGQTSFQSFLPRRPAERAFMAITMETLTSSPRGYQRPG